MPAGQTQVYPYYNNNFLNNTALKQILSAKKDPSTIMDPPVRKQEEYQISPRKIFSSANFKLKDDDPQVSLLLIFSKNTIVEVQSIYLISVSNIAYRNTTNTVT